MALWEAFTICGLGRPRARTVELRDARRPDEASMAAGAGAQAASLRESRARAPASSELVHSLYVHGVYMELRSQRGATG